MGASASRNGADADAAGAAQEPAQRLRTLFAAEYGRLQTLVSALLNDDRTAFRKKEYDFMKPTACDGYLFVLESDLKKHLRIELEDLHNAIYMIPAGARRQDATIALGEGGGAYTKQQLCGTIMDHYRRLFRMLSLIYSVFHLETEGERNLASIIMRNTGINQGVMEIRYCALDQTNMAGVNKVDFSHLAGFDAFVRDFLTPDEAHRFLHHMGAHWGRVSEARLRRVVCSEPLGPGGAATRDIYGPARVSALCSGGPATPVPVRDTYPATLQLHVARLSPILSQSMCLEKTKFTIAIDGKNKDHQRLVRLYERMHENYRKNLARVVTFIEEFVDMPASGGADYSLKLIDSDSLAALEVRLKTYIMHFYLRTLIEYQELVDLARRLKPVQVLEPAA